MILQAVQAIRTRPSSSAQTGAFQRRFSSRAMQTWVTLEAHLVPEVNSVSGATNPVDICPQTRDICLQPEHPGYELLNHLQEERDVSLTGIGLSYTC